MKKFLYFLKGYRFEFTSLLCAFSIVSGIEAVFHPILLKLIFDEGVLKGDFRRFLILVTTYLVLGLILNLLWLVLSLWGKSLENRFTKGTIKKILENYYLKDYGYIQKEGDGYFISRIYNDVVEGLVQLFGLIRQVMSEGVRLVVFIGVLIYLSWQATLLLAIIIPFATFYSQWIGRKIRMITSKERDYQGSFLSTLNKAIASFKMVVTFGLLNKTVEICENRLSQYLGINYRNYKLITTYQTSNFIAMNISDFLSMFVGALFVLKGAMTFGGYLAFVNTFWRTVTALSQLFRPLAEIHRGLEIAERLYRFESQTRRKYYAIGNIVKLKSVSFSYNDHTTVLKNFNLEIKPGEKVLVVGSNGSGKTTLANIISGYLAPQDGEIILPRKISSLTLPVAFPPLKVKDLIKDNNLLEKFGLNEMQEFYADELSAGQRQKLAVVLAISIEADLYVFDEPLVNIDLETRDSVLNEIFDRTKDKILILNMHEYNSCWKKFNKIINLDEQKIHNTFEGEITL